MDEQIKGQKDGKMGTHIQLIDSSDMKIRSRRSVEPMNRVVGEYGYSGRGAGYINQKIHDFRFRGKIVELTHKDELVGYKDYSLKGLVLNLIDAVFVDRGLSIEEFTKILAEKAKRFRGVVCISHNMDDFGIVHDITDISMIENGLLICTKRNADILVELCYNIVNAFGYSDNDLKMRTMENMWIAGQIKKSKPEEADRKAKEETERRAKEEVYRKETARKEAEIRKIADNEKRDIYNSVLKDLTRKDIEYRKLIKERIRTDNYNEIWTNIRRDGIEEIQKRTAEQIVEYSLLNKDLEKEAEKITKDADRKLLDADRKLLDADKKSLDADRKLLDAERKLLDAERKFFEAERKLSEADKKLSDIDKKLSDAERKLSEADKKLSDADRKLLEAEKLKTLADSDRSESSKNLEANASIVEQRKELDATIDKKIMANRETEKNIEYKNKTAVDAMKWAGNLESKIAADNPIGVEFGYRPAIGIITTRERAELICDELIPIGDKMGFKATVQKVKVTSK